MTYRDYLRRQFEAAIAKHVRLIDEPDRLLTPAEARQFTDELCADVEGKVRKRDPAKSLLDDALAAVRDRSPASNGKMLGKSPYADVRTRAERRQRQ